MVKCWRFSYLCQTTAGYLLISSDSDAEAFLKRLRMFVLRADVKITPTDYNIYGYDADNEQVSSQDLCVHLHKNMHLFIDVNNSYEGKINSIEHWNYLETLHGIVTLNDALRGKFILPFINIDWLGAVSYQKGCYVGQEIIARLYYRSKPAKRSYVYTTSIDLADLPLAESIACVDGDNKPCRITPVRVVAWQNKVAMMLEMSTRNAPRKTLIITHNNQQYSLNAETQPYENTTH